MARDGSGIFTVDNPDFVALTTIESSKVDANFAGIVADLNNLTNGTNFYTGAIKAAVGTVALPGIAFNGDPNSGFWWIGADNIGLSLNGIKAADFSTTGTQLVLKGYPTAGGTANALTVTTVPAVPSYATGQVVTFRAAAVNTSATVTLNVSAVGTKNIRKINAAGADIAIVAGDILDDARYTVVYDSAADGATGAWILNNPSSIQADPLLSYPAAGGTANAITLTPAAAITAYATGQVFTFTQPDVNSSATVTLNVSGVGTKNIRKADYTGSVDDIALAVGDLVKSARYTVVYNTAGNGGAGAWLLVNPSTLSLTPLAEGTYTPTLFNTTNVAASVASVCLYLRIGNRVLVWGEVQVDTTASGAATILGISLPIASAIGVSTDLAGAAGAQATANAGAAIYGDQANDRASLSYFSTTATNQFFNFHFAYRVI